MVRLGALIVVLVTGGLLVWLGIAQSGPEPMVLPLGGVENGPQDSVPADDKAREALAARTRLQDWRADSGPSPSGAVSDAVRGTQLAASDSEALPAELVQRWLAEREKEDTILFGPSYLEGTASLPADWYGVLEQPQGRTFRRTHNGEVTFGGGWVILGVTFLLALFLLLRGRIPIVEGPSDRSVYRFDALERGNHWMTAGSFVLLALSGLVLLYGQILLKPLMGASAYSWIASASLYAHVAFMLPFVIGVAIMAVLWLRQNLPSRYDGEWIRRFGGFLSDKADHPPALRFNFGQKVVFWGVFLGAILMLASGLTLMFPFLWADIVIMQWTLIAHAAIGLLMIGLIIGHIYIGTIGMEGAIDAMWSGHVDRNWAEEHHSEWVKRLDNRQAGQVS